MPASPAENEASAGVASVQEWPPFTRALLGCAAAIYLAGIALLLAVDPYDTGRTALPSRRGLPEQLPFTANASRARDPAFDAAVIGNSHVQQLSPERLDALTGLRFVQLSMPATMPDDALDVLRWFLASHRRPAPRAVVFGIDSFWCRPAPGRSPNFPAWLYAADFAEYLGGLARWRSMEASAARIGFLLRGGRAIRSDGYWSYAPRYEALVAAAPERARQVLEEPKASPVNLSGLFPPLARLAREIGAVPPETALILVRPPVYRTALPVPGTDAARTAEACFGLADRIAASRPGTVVLDLEAMGGVSDHPESFYDPDHYRDPVATEVERRLAAVLAGAAPDRGNSAAGAAN